MWLQGRIWASSCERKLNRQNARSRVSDEPWKTPVRVGVCRGPPPHRASTENNNTKKKAGGGILRVRGIRNPSDRGLIQLKPRDTLSQAASLMEVLHRDANKNTPAESDGSLQVLGAPSFSPLLLFRMIMQSCFILNSSFNTLTAPPTRCTMTWSGLIAGAPPSSHRPFPPNAEV